MGSKARWLVLLVLVSALVLLVGTVSAGSATDPTTGITLVFPESREECGATTDTIIVGGLAPNQKAIVVVFNNTAGLVEVARSEDLSPDATGSASFTFSYPAWSQSLAMYVSLEVYDISSNVWTAVFGQGLKPFGKWTLTCSPLAEACTPGYWKNHYESWVGYAPDQDFDTVFGTDLFSPNMTLQQAIRAGGGGLNVVARFGVASLLSAAHRDVDFALTVEQVIALVQARNGAALAAQFPDGEYECPLD